MTDTNAAPTEEKPTGPIRRWIKNHPAIWEFILFNVLSNISTISRFVVTWIGTAIFVSAMGLTAPFHFLIFNYPESGNGLGGFLTFLFAEVIAQVVNFFVQMKWVFSFKDAAWKYAILAVVIVVVNLVLPGYVTSLCQGWGMNAGVAGTIASVVNTLLAVIVSFPLLKFWIMPKNK